MAGYSRTPLGKKLGIQADQRIFLHDPPKHYLRLIDPLPERTRFMARFGHNVDLVHGFYTERDKLAAALERFRRIAQPNVAIWVSWPKKSSGVATDITEDTIRATALPLGFVDIKVCAVDDVWSGLKLVIRKSQRAALG